MKVINYLRKLNRKRNHKTHELKRRVKLYSVAKKIEDKRNQQLDTKDVKKILFPFVDLGIGDAVCHTGIWAKLKDAGYTIQIIAEESKRHFFEKLNCIDELHIVDMNNIQALEEINTDLVISIYSWMKRKETFNTLLLSKINYKYAISFGGWLTRPYNITIPLQKDFHITDPQKRILELLGINANNFRYMLPELSEHDSYIDDYLRPVNSEEKIIVINPFASVDERSLTPEQLNNLVANLSKTSNIKIFIIGEKLKLQKIKINNKNVSICFFDSLWHAVSLIKKADLTISVDTAIVHISSALQTKLIGIYYSVFLDHNETLKGNIIFSPHGENHKQIIFDKRKYAIDIDAISEAAISYLDEHPSAQPQKVTMT